MSEQITYRSIGGVLYASTYDAETRTGRIDCIQPRPMPTRATGQPALPSGSKTK